jgi:hypothetical protein
MELYRIVINVISLLINIGLIYLSVKLLAIFRGGSMAKPWAYISSGIFTLTIGNFLFVLQYTLSVEQVLIRAIGGLLMMFGGLLMLAGMYLEYKKWSNPTSS